MEVTCQALLLLSVLALALHQGVALRCYMCSSKQDPSCKDKFVNSQHENKLTYCSPENMRYVHDVLPGVFSTFGSYSSHQNDDFVCVKAVTREHDREVVVRSCSIPRADTFDVCSQLKSRNLAFCESCSGDACNTATSTIPSGAVLLLPALWAAFLALKY